MEEKNKLLAAKNTQLKEEIKKLCIKQKELMSVDIKRRYFDSILFDKMIEVMDENIKAIDLALEHSAKFKQDLISKKKILGEKNVAKKVGRKKK